MCKHYSVEDTLFYFYFGITPDELNGDGKVINKILKKYLGCVYFYTSPFLYLNTDYFAVEL